MTRKATKKPVGLATVYEMNKKNVLCDLSTTRFTGKIDRNSARSTVASIVILTAKSAAEKPRILSEWTRGRPV